MEQFENLMQASAGEWKISTQAARWLFWLPIVATLIVIMLQFNRDIFRFLLQEDGPVEWLSAIAFVLFLAVALIMLFAGGEEVSWGQRIFGWETPRELIEVNDQGETNLHNIGIVLQLTNLAMLLTGLYGSIAYIANRKLRFASRWDQGDFLFVPPFFLATYFLPIFIFRIARITAFTESNFTLNRLGEWAEMVVAVGLLLFFWFILRRVTSLLSSTPIAGGLT